MVVLFATTFCNLICGWYVTRVKFAFKLVCCSSSCALVLRFVLQDLLAKLVNDVPVPRLSI